MDRIVDGASTLGALMLFHDFRSDDVKSYVTMDTQKAKSSKDSEFAIENHENTRQWQSWSSKRKNWLSWTRWQYSGGILRNGNATSETIQSVTVWLADVTSGHIYDR